MKKIKDRLTLGAIAGAGGGMLSFIFGRITRASDMDLLTSLTLGSLSGVGQTYVYTLMGKDQRLLKSAGMGLLSGSIIKSLTRPKRPGFALAGNILGAVASGETIVRLGDENIFGANNLVKEMLPESIGASITIDLKPGESGETADNGGADPAPRLDLH
jgi:hypothetical protein